MTLEIVVLLLLLGSVTGVLAGLLGIGGGAIMVPMLTSIFVMMGVSSEHIVHLALGTSMACIIVTSISSLKAHHRRQGVLWPVVKSMVPGILLGAFFATYIAAYSKPIYLAVFFALFMAYVAINLFINKPVVESKQLGSRRSLFSAGAGIGAISSLVSIGGGTLTVPYLANRNVDIKQAIGTSAACGFPIALAGTLGYIVNGWPVTINLDNHWGFVYWPAVIVLSFTSYLTAPVGVKLAHSLPINTLRKVFAVFVMLISAKMVSHVL
ncbi:sulfite exporter TauE/SafE family protein [Thalassotalea maritima]|uniref:sulfite exporter TauE/SafE family protein n=1 Tax=Thalassotalea maritima TaxID=3242416 RepID=UPI0035298D10